ncbi:MAG: AMP-dependent synthetase and ligase, partial [Mucilaginibacter sp.]|nr:AMP-dependent synthetase and ligase [Mucilaginibacter sp.]
MLDLGTSFIASVARDPGAIAIVDGDVRPTYAQWYTRISSAVAAFDELGLRPGDHVITALQNRWEAATIYWACQFAGIVITPVNWRAKSDELDFCIENSEARVVVYEGASAAAVADSSLACNLRRVAVGDQTVGDQQAISFAEITRQVSSDETPRVGSEAWS